MIKSKPKSTATLIAELDEIFSKWIRYRDTDSFGYGKCFTCGQRLHFKDGDCGHGITRHHMPTRFDERNCALQCRYCNRYEGGEQKAFAAAVDKKHGPGTWATLQMLSRSTFKLTRPEIEEMVEYYKNAVRAMKKI